MKRRFFAGRAEQSSPYGIIKITGPRARIAPHHSIRGASCTVIYISIRNLLKKGGRHLKHIIFGRAASASLTYALRRKEDEVIGFAVEFSAGPLNHIYTEEGIHGYFSWLQSTYGQNGVIL